MKVGFRKISFNLNKVSQEQLFMLTILFVNAGNYLYNLLLGRILGPTQFADAAILITLLLVLSFLGMTFQLVAAKYSVLFESKKLKLFVKFISKYALISGVTIGIGIVFFSNKLKDLFQTQTASMFLIFGLGIPIYFILSINRGIYQGSGMYSKLSFTYLTEMLSRLILTLLLLFLLPSFSTSLIVAIGILVSLFFGLFPFQKSILSFRLNNHTLLDSRPIITFFALTAFYELTQIIINNSDIILVKHFFDNKQAGLYASLALIGRVVYFVAWMFVMLLLPKVVQLKKEGQDTFPVLLRYTSYIGLLSIIIVGFTALFPEFVVKGMFGSQYVSIASLLWKYALATSVFAIANIFAYYFLSINHIIPVIISAVLGSTQIVLIILFHETLEQVVLMQIVAMLILLLFQLFYFIFYSKIKNK